ncbi:hypothetical protein EJ110_NYTH20515 [Nymphaea thermarum]|nr:hypothetical protein EJ110_NYTH20515 [Nymphaea thermarum]
MPAENLTPFIQPIVEFLTQNKLPLIVNVFSHKKSDGIAASLSHYWTEAYWTEAFDDAVEAFYWAMDMIDYPSVRIVVSSTGFPSAGSEPKFSTTANTLAYNQCLVRHNNRGRRLFKKNPHWPIPAYLFTVVNSKKYPGDQLEWGLFDFNMCLVYQNSGSTKHNPANELVVLLRSLGIKKLRIPYPDHNLLKALVNTNVEVNLGIPNEDLLDLALSYEHALRWVDNNIKPYLSSSFFKIRYISVGNEIFKSEKRLWHLVLPAMQNVHEALHSYKDGSSINVSTSAFSYKKSDGTTTSSSSDWTKASDEAVEAFYRAMGLIGYLNVPIVVSSTGFPSAGGETNVATTANTLAYNQCLVRHNRRLLSKKQDWPIVFLKKPDWPISVYLFTLFNSKRYPGNKLEWGLFDFNMCPVYCQGFFSKH